MTRSHLAAIASLALFLGVAASPGIAQDAKTDKTGMSDLGADISSAGTTADENKAHLATLTPEEQAKVKEVCLVVVGEADQHTPEVVAYCENINPPT